MSLIALAFSSVITVPKLPIPWEKPFFILSQSPVNTPARTFPKPLILSQAPEINIPRVSKTDVAVIPIDFKIAEKVPDSLLSSTNQLYISNPPFRIFKSVCVANSFPFWIQILNPLDPEANSWV